MTDFKKLFESSEVAPAETICDGRKIICSDRFPVSNGDTLQFTIESTNSPLSQGFSIGIFGEVLINGEKYKKGKYIHLFFWEDSKDIDVKNIVLTVFTKEKYVLIKNIWEGVSHSGELTTCYVGSEEWLMNRGNGAAMYCENTKFGRRYYCNDGEMDNDFNDIIFSVKNLGNQKSNKHE